MANKPRIVLAVTADVSVGLLRGFPEFLAGRGWDVHVVSSPGRNLRALSHSPDITCHELPMAREPAPLRDVLSLVQWVRLLRQVRPDLVNVGTPKAGLLGSLAAALTRIPVRIYTLRGLRYETSEGIPRTFLTWMERLIVSCVHRVITISASLRDAAIHDGLGVADKFVVVGSGSSNGVDIARFSQDARQESPQKDHHAAREDQPLVVGYVGRIHPDKGIDLLVSAMSHLAARGTRIRLLVVGGADGPEGQRLMRALAACGAEVEFAGEVEDVAPYYPRMDVLCLPTKREGFGNVVIEAAAAGIPTVATKATGVVDAIIDGDTGVIVRDRKAESLAEALDLLLRNEHVRKRLGESAKRRAIEEFDQQVVWHRTERLFHELLACL